MAIVIATMVPVPPDEGLQVMNLALLSEGGGGGSGAVSFPLHPGDKRPTNTPKRINAAKEAQPSLLTDVNLWNHILSYNSFVL